MRRGPLLLLALVALGGVARAHVNGVPTRALFTAPDGLTDQADAAYAVTWTDNEIDTLATFHFFALPANVPPLAPIDSTRFGAAIPLTPDGIACTDTADAFTWDSSAVPTGSYFLYCDSNDGIFEVYSFSGGVVRIVHGSDPLPPAVVVSEPDGLADVVDADYVVQYRADAVGAATVDLRFGRLEVGVDSAGPFDPLALALAVTSGADATAAWDTSALANGSYFVEATIRDETGATFTSYSPGVLAVFHGEESPDAGVPPGGDDGGIVVPGDDDDGGGGRCAAGGASAGEGLLAAVVIGLWAVRRRRRG